MALSDSAGVGSALPSQVGQSGNVLGTDGTIATWQSAGGGGITALTGDVTASGSGSVAATITNAVKSVAAVGSAPAAAGASIATTVLTLQPADATNPGVVTAGTQTFGGIKTIGGLIHQPTNAFDGTKPALVWDTPNAIGIYQNSTSLIFNNAISASNFTFRLFNIPSVSMTQNGVDLSVATTSTLKCATTDSTGTPGNATINKMSGKSAIASSASTCVITNSLVAATDIVQITPLDLDTTAIQFKAVCTSTTITVTVNAAATATTKFQWTLFKTA